MNPPPLPHCVAEPQSAAWIQPLYEALVAILPTGLYIIDIHIAADYFKDDTITPLA